MLALSEIGNHTVIHSEECEIAYDVWKVMSEEALNGIKVPLKSLIQEY
jgi:hypothetical protein